MNWGAVAALVALALIGGTASMTTQPRGIRNNNPGNLRITDIPWQRKLPIEQNTDGDFEQFESPVWGIRALYIDVTGKIERQGLDNIETLLHRYAPPVENDTGAYIDSVARQVGIGPKERIAPVHYDALIRSIIRHENGQQPYSDSLIQEAIALA